MREYKRPNVSFRIDNEFWEVLDNKAEEIDKVMKVLTQKKEKNNKDASCYEKGYIIGKTRKIVEDKKEQSDSKKTISTTRKKESKKEENNIITNNNPNNYHYKRYN